MLSDMALKRVGVDNAVASMENDDSDDDNNDTPEALSGFCMYKSSAAFLDDYNARLPLSVIVLSNGILGGPLRGERLMLLQQVNFYGTMLGHSYHEWTVGETVDLNTKDITKCALFLPKLTIKGLLQ